MRLLHMLKAKFSERTELENGKKSVVLGMMRKNRWDNRRTK